MEINELKKKADIEQFKKLTHKYLELVKMTMLQIMVLKYIKPQTQSLFALDIPKI